MLSEELVGQLLNGRYKVLDQVGQGAMGAVYRASEVRTGRIVALKILGRDLALDAEMIERFHREGEALWKLRHPNIVSFVDMFSYHGQYVIVMEYVPGGSLHALIKREEVLSPDRARKIALGLCNALIQAHQFGIVHRDLKPENVLIDRNDMPRLTDFGVARLLDRSTRLTGTGMQIGTPHYMSPEAWQGQPLDAQTDIWSLGVILFEMLAGQVPFGGDTAVVVMTRVMTSPLPDLRTMRPGMPEGLVQIVTRMLSRDKAIRYLTMRQVAADLRRGVSAEHVSTQVVKSTFSSPIKTQPSKMALDRLPAASSLARYSGLVVFGVVLLAAMITISLGVLIPSVSLVKPTLVVRPTTRLVATATISLKPPSVISTDIVTPSLVTPSASRVSTTNAAEVRLKTLFASSSAGVLSLAYSPDGALLAAVRGDKSLRVWETSSLRLVHSFASNANCLDCLVFSSDGQTLVTISIDRPYDLVAWDISTAQARWKTAISPSQTDAAITSLAFSPDGKILAWANNNETATLWSVFDQRELYTLLGHTAVVQSVSFSATGRQVVTASSDRTLKIWDVASGTLQRTLAGHADEVTKAIFSPDGRWIASGGRDQTVRLWDSTTGQLLWTMSANAKNVNSLAFSPDGQVLASGGLDNAIILWNAATGQQLNRLIGHTGPVVTLAFSPDGQMLASGSTDGTLQLWEVHP